MVRANPNALFIFKCSWNKNIAIATIAHCFVMPVTHKVSADVSRVTMYSLKLKKNAKDELAKMQYVTNHRWPEFIALQCSTTVGPSTMIAGKMRNKAEAGVQ